MPVRTTWVVVADPTRAVVYAITKGMARLRELETLEPAPGAHPDGPGAGFAADIGWHLERALEGGRLDELVLVASPAFLVLLRAQLSGPLRAALVGEIDGGRLGPDGDTLQAAVLKIL